MRPSLVALVVLALAPACSSNDEEQQGPSTDAGDDGSSGSGGSTSSGGTGGQGGGAGSGTAGSGGSSGGGGGNGGAAAGAGSAAYVFEEVDGLVGVEAEHFSVNDARGLVAAWYLTSSSVIPGITPDPDPPHFESASQTSYLELLPDTRVTHDDPLKNGENFFSGGGDGPTLSYQIYFNTPGTYIVWARAYSTGGEDNGIHVGIDGSFPTSGEKLQFCSGKNAWTWSSAQRDSGGSACGTPKTITLKVPAAGLHTIAFSAREDGFELDKWVMAKDTSFEPNGEGPPERPYSP